MKRIKYLFMFMLVAVMLTGCTSTVDKAKEAADTFNSALETYNGKTTEYNTAAQSVIDSNGEMDKLLDEAQKVIDKGEDPFDPETLTSLKDVMSEATKAEVKTPEKLPEYEKWTVDENADSKDLKAKIKQSKEDVEAMEAVEVPETPEVPDYSEILDKLKTSLQDYEDSIQGLKQITAPEDDFVMDRLKGIKTITEIQAVSEDHDPNGLLNKQGGYIGCIYYRDSQVPTEELYIESGDDTVDIGTDGGGAVEIFKTVDGANARNDYLASFDGTISSGSHYVYGTCILRTSEYLKASEQEKLTEEVLNALLKVK